MNTHTHTSQVAEVAAGLEHPTGPVKESAMLHNSAASVFLSPKEFVASRATQKLMNLMTGRAVTPLTRRMGAFCGRTNTAEGSSWDTLKGWHTLKVGERRRTSSQHPDGLRAIKLQYGKQSLDDHASCFLLGRSNSF